MCREDRPGDSLAADRCTNAKLARLRRQGNERFNHYVVCTIPSKELFFFMPAVKRHVFHRQDDDLKIFPPFSGLFINKYHMPPVDPFLQKFAILQVKTRPPQPQRQFLSRRTPPPY